MSNITLPMTPQELEALVRRVVREEMYRILRRPRSILEDPNQEGPDDPAEDALLLQEALSVLQNASEQPEAWANWDDFLAELDRSEAASGLPD